MIGYYITGAFVVLYYAITLWFCRGLRLHARDITCGALAIALTALLSYMTIPLPGGSGFSFAPLPLIMLALLYDHRVAMVSGVACGILLMLAAPGWAPVHWAQIFVEHILCFSALGYAGIFGYQNKPKMIFAIVLANLIKLSGHVLSGVLFFSQNAWAGWGPWAYSIGFNAPPIIAQTIIFCLMALTLPLGAMSRAIKGRNKV